jgi:hypothetical protein
MDRQQSYLFRLILSWLNHLWFNFDHQWMDRMIRRERDPWREGGGVMWSIPYQYFVCFNSFNPNERSNKDLPYLEVQSELQLWRLPWGGREDELIYSAGRSESNERVGGNAALHPNRPLIQERYATANDPTDPTTLTCSDSVDISSLLLTLGLDWLIDWLVGCLLSSIYESRTSMDPILFFFLFISWAVSVSRLVCLFVCLSLQ